MYKRQEQGGVNSSDLYKIVNNEQLTVPHETDFGVKLVDTGSTANNRDAAGDIHIASIGQADDTVLLSMTSSIFNFFYNSLSTSVASTTFNYLRLKPSSKHTFPPIFMVTNNIY